MTNYEQFIEDMMKAFSINLNIPIAEVKKNYNIDQSYSREYILGERAVMENIRKNYAVIQEEIYKDFLLEEVLHDHI